MADVYGTWSLLGKYTWHQRFIVVLENFYFMLVLYRILYRRIYAPFGLGSGDLGLARSAGRFFLLIWFLFIPFEGVTR